MGELITVVLCAIGAVAATTEPWTMHVIDDSSRGADGARLADANGDGLMDIATPWEQGGLIRIYLHPGPDNARAPWPAVTVGRVPSPEDAVLVDLDGDGATDVVSACEGPTRALFVHWAPAAPEDYLHEAAWQTQPFPSAPPVQWMYSAPADIDGRNGIDLIVGAKNERAVLGWLESPQDPRDVSAWQWHPICPAGWIMSIVPLDKDRDGDVDILISDRKGAGRGCYLIEHPGIPDLSAGQWSKQLLFGEDAEVMFLDMAGGDIACASAGAGIFLRRSASDGMAIVRFPWPERSGTGKAVALGDLDLDGELDMAISAEHAQGERGVQWLSLRPPLSPEPARWQPISSLDGTKYDAVRLHDIDGDGDLDLLTCEERDNLGVIWYENPLRRVVEEE